MITKKYVLTIISSILLKGLLLFLFFNGDGILFDNLIANYLIIFSLLCLVGYVDIELGYQTAKM